MTERRPTVCVSGGFDPLHVGHVRLIEGAAYYGFVHVLINSDDWLLRKKGYAFMTAVDRAEIMLALTDVRWVTILDSDSDGTVSGGLCSVLPDFFANGGDRTRANPKEHRACQRLGVIELFGIGGKKICSSSEIVERLRR